MTVPQDLLYSKDHEWVKIEGDSATIGITDYAQESMGDIVLVNLPAEGDSFAAEDTLCDIESVKAVSDILCPVGGTVTEVNEELMDAPEKINQDAYGAWLVKVSGVEGADALMSAAEYEEFLKEA